MSRVRGSRPLFYDTEKHKPGSTGQKMPESDRSSFLCPFKCERALACTLDQTTTPQGFSLLGLIFDWLNLEPRPGPAGTEASFMYVTVVLVLPLQGSRW